MTTSNDIVTLHNADPDAAKIGDLYAQARGSMVEAMRFAAACGLSLIKKKQSLAHGQWLPWLEANADVLGFKDRTANLLMKAASDPQLTADLMGNVDDATALAISRRIWGNATSQPKAPKCEQTGDVSLSDTRTDSKGRKQPAHKPPTPPATAPKPTTDSDKPSCSFCGKGPDDDKVSTLIVSQVNPAAICNECVDLCVDVIAEQKKTASHVADEIEDAAEASPSPPRPAPHAAKPPQPDDLDIPECLRRRPS